MANGVDQTATTVNIGDRVLWRPDDAATMWTRQYTRPGNLTNNLTGLVMSLNPDNTANLILLSADGHAFSALSSVNDPNLGTPNTFTVTNPAPVSPPAPPAITIGSQTLNAKNTYVYTNPISVNVTVNAGTQVSASVTISGLLTSDAVRWDPSNLPPEIIVQESWVSGAGTFSMTLWNASSTNTTVGTINGQLVITR